MKKLLLLLVASVVCTTLFSQLIDSSQSNPKQVFTIVELMPEFAGGEAALFKFIQENVNYPVLERDNNILGRVIVGFVVYEDGSVHDVEVKKGVSAGLDKEAKRVVEMLPNFKAGKMQGKEVKVAFVLPIMFKLKLPAPIATRVANSNLFLAINTKGDTVLQ